MLLIHEDLARAHSQRSARAEAADRHRRLVAAARAQRRAERAVMRARRLLAQALAP